MASRVVGTSSSRDPRLKIEAAKAVMSQMTPPPIPTKVLARWSPPSRAVRMMVRMFSMVLWLSPGPSTSRVWAPFL